MQLILLITSLAASHASRSYANVYNKVQKEPEGDICDDSCEWSNDGVCDDGTAPAAEDDWAESDWLSHFDWGALEEIPWGGLEETGQRRDVDWSGTYDDELYYANFDDDARLPACAPGTDCTDCQPLHGDATKTAPAEAECDNTCEFARDGFCDDSRTTGYCALGTDCQDCGPASSGKENWYWDDDLWWDDDKENWYWGDDYYDDDFDQRRFDALDPEPADTVDPDGASTDIFPEPASTVDPDGASTDPIDVPPADPPTPGTNTPVDPPTPGTNQVPAEPPTPGTSSVPPDRAPASLEPRKSRRLRGADQ